MMMMMIAALRRNVPPLCFKNSTNYLRKSHLGFETHIVPLLRFSTSADWKGEEVSSFVYEFLVQKHHFSPQSASHIASAVPYLRNPETSVSLLSFLNENGFSNSQLEKIVTAYPHFLAGDLENSIKPKIKNLQVDFNLSLSDIARMVTKHPRMFRHIVDFRLLPDSVPLPEDDTTLDTNSLLPNVELLKNCGVSMDQIVWHVYRFKSFMCSKHERMITYVGKVDAMGVSRNSSQFITSVRIVGEFGGKHWEHQLTTLGELGVSEDDVAAAFRRAPTVFGWQSWEPKFKTLCELGFSVGDVNRAFRNHPRMFAFLPEKMKKTAETILANGKYDILCIVNYPMSLTYSVEKRYKPRMQVLELLEGKNLIRSWPHLSRLCTMTNKQFYGKYVAPFLGEIGDDHIANSFFTRG